jgi:integrase
MKFTRDTVAAFGLPQGKSDHFVWDSSLPGFGCRVKGSSKSWVVQYRVGRQQRRESLGDIRKVTLEDARRIARNRFAQVELGIDPAAEKAKARQATVAALTLGAVAARYLEAKQAVVRPNTFRQSQLHLTVHWQSLRDRPIDIISRADVAARLQDLMKDRGRLAAAKARRTLAAMYVWAIKEGFCDLNPVAATNDPGRGIKPRDRVLADDEITAIWNACEDLEPFGHIVRLLLLSGCRRMEIGGLRWSEINLDTGTLAIPGTRTKSHLALELTLPAAAVEILRLVPRRADREFVFSSRSGGPFSAWSSATSSLNARIIRTEGKPLEPWSLHDIRRTVRSGIGRLGVRPDVAERVLGHARPGIEAVYDRYKYGPEIKTALALWADHVRSIVEGRNQVVVPMRA